MIDAIRAVFDCKTFLQALAAPEGPAGRCVQLAFDGGISLFVSPFVLEELRNVTSRPKVIAKLRIVVDRVADFREAIEVAATVLDGFPERFAYQRDPDDAPYVNLAIAANATRIVSPDKDLLDLMDPTKPEAAEFQVQFPSLRIVNPVEFLREMESLQ
jgi:putative PIN family toxin of toxin-antitoxin system